MFKRAYVEITNVCNLKCSFCPGTVREKKFITTEEFRHIAAQVRRYTQYLYLHVMGEPLLHPELGQLLDIAEELRFRVLITTNGTLLPRAGGMLLHPVVHKVAVSLHSFEGNDGGEMRSYLEGVWAFAEKATSAGKLVALRLWNEGGAESRNGEIFAFLSEKLGYDTTSLPIDPRGNRKLAERLYLESDVKFDWPDMDADRRDVEFCHGLRQQMAVLCDGTVVPCCLDGNGTIALGNALREDLDDILASPRAKAMAEGFARRQVTEELCRRCGYATRFTK